jgi:hypothetical protein
MRRGDRGGPRDHDRDRWDDAPPRRVASPSHPPRDSVPAPLTWFLGLLPSAGAFDGESFPFFVIRVAGTLYLFRAHLPHG